MEIFLEFWGVLFSDKGKHGFSVAPSESRLSMFRPGTTSGSSGSTGALHLRLAEESFVEVEAAVEKSVEV